MTYFILKMSTFADFSLYLHRFLTKLLELVFQIHTFLNLDAQVKQSQILQNLTNIISKINGTNKCN